MTEQLAHRDLRNRSAEILREVAAGASYEITNHGEVVALLTPPAPDGRLRIRKATSRRPFSRSSVPDAASAHRPRSTTSAVTVDPLPRHVRRSEAARRRRRVGGACCFSGRNRGRTGTHLQCTARD